MTNYYSNYFSAKNMRKKALGIVNKNLAIAFCIIETIQTFAISICWKEITACKSFYSLCMSLIVSTALLTGTHKLTEN